MLTYVSVGNTMQRQVVNTFVPPRLSDRTKEAKKKNGDVWDPKCGIEHTHWIVEEFFDDREMLGNGFVGTEWGVDMSMINLQTGVTALTVQIEVLQKAHNAVKTAPPSPSKKVRVYHYLCIIDSLFIINSRLLIRGGRKHKPWCNRNFLPKLTPGVVRPMS